MENLASVFAVILARALRTVAAVGLALIAGFLIWWLL